MDRREALKRVAVEVGGGELSFPSNVAVALKIQHSLDDPDLHLGAAARLIQAEPLLAARVVATANAVAYNRSGQLITDVATAVARVGLVTVRTLAHALIVRQLAGVPSTPAHREIAHQLWMHTAHVASLARLIARRVTRQSPDTALFAGLVQDVGGFYLIARARDYPALLAGGHHDADEPLEALIGDAVLRRLGVPGPVITAVKVVWNGFLAIPPESLGDTVLLAKQLAPVASPLLLAEGETADHARAVIDMSVTSEDGEAALSAILQESAAEIDSLARALQF